MKLTIRKKLFLSFFLIIALTIGLGIYSIFSIETIRDKSEQIINNKTNIVTSAVKDSNDNNAVEVTYEGMKKNLIAGIAIIIILSVVIAFKISNEISKRINIITEILNRMGEFDFGYDELAHKRFISFKSSDEITDMGSMLNESKAEIRNLIDAIKSNSKEVANTSNSVSLTLNETAQSIEGIAKATDEVAEGTMNLAKNLEDAASNVNLLSEEINKIVYSSHLIKKYIKDTNKVNIEGVQHISKLEKAVNDNSIVTGKIAEQVFILGNGSEEIGKITDTIKDITDQINLLSLNATIEAARAGESGKGFSVVAEEIRKLANETVISTREIDNIIMSFKKEVDTIKSQMMEVKASIDQTTIASDDTKDSFNNIENVATSMVEQIDSLIQNIESMSSHKDQVLKFMDGISAISQQSASSTQEILASVEEQTASIEQISQSTNQLKKISDNLGRLIEKFKT